MLLTRTRVLLLAAVAVLGVGLWSGGLGVVPLTVLGVALVAAILLTPRRVPVRNRPASDFDDGRDLTRFGWSHPLATSMLLGGAFFGWINGTGRDPLGSGGDGLGGADALGGGDLGGGDFGGGGGSE